MKGQKAHSSGHIRPESRDIIKKLPKLRGYRFKSRQEKPVVVNVGMLEGTFKAGEDVTPKTLVSKGLVRRIKKGRIPHVKILGHGSLKKKLVLSGVVVSETARKHIEKAGGNISE
jgi:large subunit ribosomal protein L15|tara:strand:+ start:111 stop:455 length:345 start_codon:yes stop_codon:yes gene_type:complete